MARHAQCTAGARQLQLGLAVEQDHGGEAPRVLGCGFIAVVDADVGADQLQARGQLVLLHLPLEDAIAFGDGEAHAETVALAHGVELRRGVALGGGGHG